jgi:MFS family permease
MTYLREFATNWQALTAACLGLVAGTISNYVSNLFSPELVATFGWEKSQFALVGLTVVIAALFLPIVGRLADRHGMRRIAIIGVTGLPLVFVGLGLQQGSFALFFMLSLAQMLIISALAGIVVYNRLIVRTFDRARGLALGVASCAPAVAAAVGSPLLSLFIGAHGWRQGYFLMAAITAVVGGAAMLMIPRDFDDRNLHPAVSGAARRDYGEIFRNRAFLIIFGAMLFCNIHFTMQTTQLKLILLDIGIGTATSSAMISSFAVGVIVGRIACGMALDRFPPRIVAAICFLLPSVGLMTLSAGTPSVPLIAFAVMSLGFSLGAEGDIAAYLVTRYFRPGLFSTILGLFAAAMACSALVGALILSGTVGATGSYSLFLAIAATTMFIGSLSFLFLRPVPDRERDEPAAVAISGITLRPPATAADSVPRIP